MSDVMLLGVLGMPLPDDPAELDLMTWMQVKSWMLEAHERITSDADLIAALEAEVARLREALTEERLENLWNAYNTGHERDGKWSHSFMSDGEWLIGEIGLDPSKGWYDAAEVKRLIPDAARAILAPPPEGETP